MTVFDHFFAETSLEVGVGLLVGPGRRGVVNQAHRPAHVEFAHVPVWRVDRQHVMHQQVARLGRKRLLVLAVGSSTLSNSFRTNFFIKPDRVPVIITRNRLDE